MTKEQVVIKDVLVGDLRIDRIEYTLHVNHPGSGVGGILILRGLLDQDLEREAKAVFKLLVENGWMSNPLMSKTTYYDRHQSIHAEVEREEKPPPAKV